MKATLLLSVLGVVPLFAQHEVDRNPLNRHENVPAQPSPPAPPPAPPPEPRWKQLSDRALASDELRGIYTSPSQPSGGGKDWGYWYTFTTPPAPAGYVISEFDYELSATYPYFRGCHSWGECKLVNQDSSTATIQWRTQGEENKFGNDVGGFLTGLTKGKAISASLTVVVIYRKQP